MLRLTAISLLSGVITTIATAWIAAVIYSVHPTILNSYIADGYTNGMEIGVGATHRIAEKSILASQYALEEDEHKATPDVMPSGARRQSLVNSDLPKWSIAYEAATVDIPIAYGGNAISLVAIDRAFGFPLPCLRYRIVESTEPVIGEGDFLGSELTCGISLFSKDGSWMGWPSALPLCPILWPSFVNVVCYSLITFIPLFVLKRRRGTHQVRRGPHH